MARDFSKVLLVTANVGSIFEDPEKMLKMWIAEFLSSVKQLDPEFLAIHMQEVGGKNYEESMIHVNSFVKVLLASEELSQYDKARFILDEDFTAVDKFTALGCIYFIHQSVQNVQIWDFQELQFVPVSGREVLSGSIENVPIKEKAKFPQEFFPDLKWSRKGFIRTRWSLYNTVFDLINIHLFHDASNIIAMESSPSQYSESRKRALRHTLERIANDQYNKVPYCMFGDFNFRLDCKSLMKTLTSETVENKTLGKKNDVSKITYTNPDNQQVVLSIGKKDFEHHQHSEIFSNNNGEMLHDYDKEPALYKDYMFEYRITFPPSYPFSEDTNDGLSYMKTRCPAWCDRLMLNPAFKDILFPEAGPPEYNMMGSNICMGDHKPIFLDCRLKKNTGNCDEKDKEQTERTKNPLKKVISINGEEVEASSMHEVNIHDFTSFERESLLTRKFKSTIRRRDSTDPYTPSPPGPKRTFKQIVKEMIIADSVLKALRNTHHISDDEDDDDDSHVATPAVTPTSAPPTELDKVPETPESVSAPAASEPATSDPVPIETEPSPPLEVEGANSNVNNNVHVPSNHVDTAPVVTNNNVAKETVVAPILNGNSHDNNDIKPTVSDPTDIQVTLPSNDTHGCQSAPAVANNNQTKSNLIPLASEEHLDEEPPKSRRPGLMDCCAIL